MSDPDTRLDEETVNRYWAENLRLMATLLLFWFFVSFGCSIVFVDWLNQFRLGGYQLGFWFAQQGSIYLFVVLIFVYAKKMEQIEKRYR